MPQLELSKIFRRIRLPGQRPVTGFTLIELAIAMAIIGLLLGALLVPLASFDHSRKNKATLRDMEEIKQALLGFAVSSGRLPCPDSFCSDGREDLVAPAPACDGSGRTCEAWQAKALSLRSRNRPLIST